MYMGVIPELVILTKFGRGAPHVYGGDPTNPNWFVEYL